MKKQKFFSFLLLIISLINFQNLNAQNLGENSPFYTRDYALGASSLDNQIRCTGDYELTIVPFTQKNGQGIRNISKRFTFKVDGDQKLNSITVVNATTGQIITDLQ